MLKHEFHTPAPELKQFITGYHILQGTALEEHQKISTLSKMYILINFGDKLMARNDKVEYQIHDIQFYGIPIKPREFGQGVPDLKIVAVELKSEIVFSIVKESMQDMVDQIVDSGYIHKVKYLQHLPEKLAEAVTSEERIEILNQAFFRFFSAITIPNDPLLLLLLDSINVQRGNISNKSLTFVSGYSERNLRRKMVDKIGIPTIKYSNIIRSEYVLARLLTMNEKSVLDVVHEFQYFDQSHLIHEMRKNICMTPRQISPSTTLLSLSKVLHDRF